MNQKLLSVAKGEAPADLVIRNGKIVNVYSGEIYDGGVAVCGDTIAAVGDVDSPDRKLSQRCTGLSAARRRHFCGSVITHYDTFSPAVCKV